MLQDWSELMSLGCTPQCTFSVGLLWAVMFLMNGSSKHLNQTISTWDFSSSFFSWVSCLWPIQSCLFHHHLTVGHLGMNEQTRFKMCNCEQLLIKFIKPSKHGTLIWICFLQSLLVMSKKEYNYSKFSSTWITYVLLSWIYVLE